MRKSNKWMKILVTLAMTSFLQAGVISITNPGFELPGYETDAGGLGDDTNWVDVPGWTAAGLADTSGTTNAAVNSGTYSGKISGYDNDDGMYQLTGHTISADEEFTLTFWSRDAFSSADGLVNTATLFYDTPANVIDTLDFTVTRYTAPGGTVFQEFSLTTTATPGSVSGTLGVMFGANKGTNTSTGIFLLVDDVELSVVPEPSTMALFSIAGGLMLLVLRRRSC